MGHAATRCTRSAMTIAGRAGGIWVARVRVGVSYDRHDTLKQRSSLRQAL